MRGPGVREPVEAVAAQVPALPPLGRQRVGRRGRRHPGVERGVEAGDGGCPGQDAADRSRSRAATSAGGAGARSVSAWSRRRTRSSITTGSTNSLPPWTTRWPTASIAPGPPDRRADRDLVEAAARRGQALGEGAASSSSRTESLRLLEPALTTRTRTPRPTSAARSSSRISGASSPSVARVGAAAQPLVDHPLPQVRRPRAEPGDAVDHVHDQVEAVEVVEHDHVERRRRRALLLVAADVDVRVVRAPVGEPVDQPRVPVVGEDDRPVGGEEGVELAVGEPVRVLALRLEPHQVDDVHDPHLQRRAARGAGCRPRRASRASGCRRSRP